jgi:SAM-dependent methyltransferase
MRACSAIAGAVGEYGRSKEIHERTIRGLLDRLSPIQINNLLYRLFAPHYDEHMELHESAMRTLFPQVPSIERLAFAHGNCRLVHDNVLDLTCGTGTSTKLLIDALPLERARGMTVTANDISDEMKAIAREKLAPLKCSVGYISQDISHLRLRRTFGTILLCQTLHLITDPEIVRQERQHNYRYVQSDRHLDAKFNAIENAWSHLEGGGTMIIMDEWPALLSDRGGPLGEGFAYLFNDSLRPIDYEDLRHCIMNDLPGSRFVAQLKSPIDGKHAMHAIIYQKQPRAGMAKRKLPLPGNGNLRNEAVRRVLATFRAIDRRFIESFQVPEGQPWVQLRHMNPSDVHISRTGTIPAHSKPFDSIVLDRCFHDLIPASRHRTLKNAIQALKVGGSLVVIEEWPNPASETGLRKSQLRSRYMKRHARHLVYGGAIRVPIHPRYDSGMFGYQYWRVL